MNEASSMFDETTMEGNGVGADEIGQEGQAGDGGEWFSTSLILTDILTILTNTNQISSKLYPFN